MSFLSSVFRRGISRMESSSYQLNQQEQPISADVLVSNSEHTSIEKEQFPILPEIPEELFVEYSPPKNTNHLLTRNILNSKRMDTNEKNEGNYDLQYLYTFLEKDYQQEGYNDALSNPDMSNMEEKVKLIRMQLDITIAKVNTYYSGVLRIVNFHIESRSRNGMVDIVDELISKKANLEEEINKVGLIEQGAKTQSGISETLIMSYKLGFKNGYAAISHSQLI